MPSASDHLLTILRMCFAGGRQFTLNEVYAVAEGPLAAIYPNNHSIQPKTRATLQLLRDDGHVTFVDNRGTYSII